MKRIFITAILFSLVLTGCSMDEPLDNDNFILEEYNLEVKEGNIYGTLTLPKDDGPFPVALIIQGSGPTDRDGNSTIGGKNNSLKMLAEALANEGIASVRYDKRGIGASMDLVEKEEDLLFEDYIEDAILWADKLQKDNRFDEIYIIGHSEGALIGAAAASKTNIQGFISIAGMGKSPYDTLVRQLENQPGDIFERSLPILDELKKGNLVHNPPKDLAPLFRESVQPYLISWFKYDPKEVISNVKAPILIIQGDNDIQVTVEDAIILNNAVDSDLIIIKGMNHILKDAPKDEKGNLETYNKPDLPLNSEVARDIINFISIGN